MMPTRCGLIESENLRQMESQIFDEITGAAHAKLAKVTKVFANLRRIQIELLGEVLRRDCLDSRSGQLVQATQVNAQTVRGEL